MADRFDTLAKDTAGDLTRRESFRRVGWGVVAAFLASVGLARADSNTCASRCSECCKNLDLPPRSPAHGQCMSDCQANTNLCGQAVRAGGCTE